LEERGARILGRNIRLGRGEIDLHVDVGSASVAVEVKTLLAGIERDDALTSFTPAKAVKVRRYAKRLDPPSHRVDLVAVTVRPSRVDLRWVPFAG
jgi:Holliday junction resolvase-like predicted endonuclease